ncbi:hypothetical protein BGW80DRAFT_1354295 [Lactifluus volemus]|nr:hypothetical protein BGW80DRAFT_1354295 [Lactifluus volemus]
MESTSHVVLSRVLNLFQLFFQSRACLLQVVAVARPGYTAGAIEDGETSGLKHDTVARLDAATNVRERDLETYATT